MIYYTNKFYIIFIELKTSYQDIKENIIYFYGIEEFICGIN